MTQNRNQTTKKTREPNPPALVAYHVTERGRGRKFWTRIGAAWCHKEGEGITLFLDVVPVNFDGRVVLLPPKAKDESPEENGAYDPETGEVPEYEEEQV
jgi:hypothetical protein